MFQSTPARGGRPAATRALDPPKNVSIHARPRRATGDPWVIDRGSLVSIHARPRRATGIMCNFLSGVVFQSTPARGGRQDGQDYLDVNSQVSIHARPRRATSGSISRQGPIWCFNPRPPAAGDSRLPPSPPSGTVSIHARPRRATAGGAHAVV